MNTIVHWTQRSNAYTPDGRIKPELFTPPRMAFLRKLKDSPCVRPSMGRSVVQFAVRMRLAEWDASGRSLILTESGRAALDTYGQNTAA